MAEEIKKLDHKNIFEALSAFQGENPEIKKTKHFGKEGEKIHFMYAPLDEVLSTVRPLLAKHGLAVIHEGNDKGEIVCSLYHTTYKVEVKEMKTSTDFYTDGVKDRTEVVEQKVFEEGVIRSLPVKVKRSGEMKEIGSDSTYARRYTLSEVLGIASDEDKDMGVQEKAQKNVESFAFSQAKNRVKELKNEKEVEEKIKIFNADLALIAKNKAPSLGLKKDQYEALIKLTEERRNEILGINNADIKVEPEDDGSVPPEDVPNLEEAK